MKTTDLHKPQLQSNAQSNARDVDYSVPLIEVSENSYQEPLAAMVYGDPGGGKSRFIATSPDPIGVIPLERKTRQTVLHTAKELNKRVIMPEIDLIRPARAALTSVMPEACVVAPKGLKPEDGEKYVEREMQKKAAAIPLDGEQPTCCTRCYYRWHVNREKSVAFRMAERTDIRTIAIDTFGQFVDDVLFANYGRNERIMPLDRKSFNREVSDFLNTISHKNLILTHHSSTIWRDNKPTNKTKPASSFSKIGHYATVIAHLEREDTKRPAGIEGLPVAAGIPLIEQGPPDQVAGEDEEQTWSRPPERKAQMVIRQDQQDRDPANCVESF